MNVFLPFQTNLIWIAYHWLILDIDIKWLWQCGQSLNHDSLLSTQLFSLKPVIKDSYLFCLLVSAVSSLLKVTYIFLLAFTLKLLGFAVCCRSCEKGCCCSVSLCITEQCDHRLSGCVLIWRAENTKNNCLSGLFKEIGRNILYRNYLIFK